MRGRHAAVAVIVMGAALTGCSTDGDAEEIGPPPGETVAGAAFFADPGQFAGERITLIAEIDEVLHPDAFAVVPTVAAEDLEVLVVHSGDFDAEVGSSVSVTGTLVEAFDPPNVQPFRDDFDDLAFEAFVGDPYLEADAIDKTPVEQTTDPNA